MKISPKLKGRLWLREIMNGVDVSNFFMRMLMNNTSLGENLSLQ
jgi:hypothetical protein